MTSYHHGWLYMDDVDGPEAELFNHARTAAYLANSTVLGCGMVSGVLDDGGCGAYRWGPVANILTDSEGVPLVDEETGDWLIEDDGSPAGWLEQTFVDPVNDPAPWYNPSYPESGEALGFWITEWTGLDSGHIQRTLTQLGSYGGGGQLSVTGSRAREMGFEVILLGESERALDYLFRWLDATLSSVCSSCATNTILIRRFCPDVETSDPDGVIDGVVELREVGMVSGLQWGAPPVERAGCFIRSVNFTMAAGDPCMYSTCTDQPVTQAMDWDACWADANLDTGPSTGELIPYTGRTSCRPTCYEIADTCRLAFEYEVDSVSGSAPVVSLTTSLAAEGSVPMRIRTYFDPHGLGSDAVCAMQMVGELYVASLPPNSEFIYDISGRKVLFSDTSTGQFVNGFAYVEPNTAGAPRFFTQGCGQYVTVVEPSDFCIEAAPDIEREYAEVALVTRERMGCA